MRNGHEIPIKHLSAEAAAIVLSILLAFWIDASWEERQDRENEQVVLAALVEEFKSKKITLKIRRAFNEEILKSTTMLINASVDSGYSLTAAELDGQRTL